MEGKLATLIFTLFCISVTHAGVSYIRWGRTSCPNGNILLYKGYMVGNHHQGRGNGANFLCTTQNPQSVRALPGMQQEGISGKLWGVEFENWDPYKGLLLTDNLNGGELHNQDMLCARCHIPDSSDVFMLPGRIDCEKTGYELQYKGFLTSVDQWSDRGTTEYVCMDESPEGRIGGTGNDDQSLVYPVQFECGSLPCNPYVNGIEATCAVCAY